MSADAAGIVATLYAGSKEMLAATAVSHGLDGKMAYGAKSVGARQPTLEENFGGFLFTSMRDSMDTGCPMDASCSEVARQGDAVSGNFTSAFRQQVAPLEKSLDKSIAAPLRRKIAVVAVASEIRAVAVSRAMAKADAPLADEVLEAVFQAFETVHADAKTR